MTNSRKLENYVSVAERVHDAQAEIIRIETTEPVMLADKMGYIRATIYMRNDRSASATATFVLGLQGQGARATNPIEDCETSAVGRALAFLGYSADKRMGYSIASREEIEEAIRREIAVEKLQDTVQDAKQTIRNSREDLRDRMVAKISSLINTAKSNDINISHPLLSIYMLNGPDELSEAELAALGKYLAGEVSNDS